MSGEEIRNLSKGRSLLNFLISTGVESKTSTHVSFLIKGRNGESIL